MNRDMQALDLKSPALKEVLGIVANNHKKIKNKIFKS